MGFILESIKNIPLTFYSRSFYYQLVHRWKGIGMTYILLVTVISTISIALESYVSRHEISRQMETILNVMPASTFKKGKLSIDAPSPWSFELLDMKALKDPPAGTSMGPARLVIDTSYKTGDVDLLTGKMDRENILVFITADKIILRNEKSRDIEVHELSPVPDGTYTHEDWASLGRALNGWFYPLITCFSALGIFVADFFLVLCAAILIKILAALLMMKTEFSAAMRLIAAAGIPVTVTAAFLPVPFFLKTIIWVGYAAYGLHAASYPEGRLGKGSA